MPLLKIKISGEPDKTLADRVAAALIELTARMLGKDPAVTAVVIDFVAPKFWNIGASSLERLDLRGYALEIGVTAGTNTKMQVSEFLSQTHAVFERMLGNIHPTSYAIVHEIPAANWGFGGVSQEHRFIVGRLPS